MRVLGLTPEDFLVVKRAQDLVEARELLSLVKQKARRGFRKAARMLHPDHGGDSQMFVRIKAVLDHIEQLEVKVPFPQPRVRRREEIRINRVYFGSSLASATTGETYGNGPGAVYTVVIR